jgi:hypothetical protein
MRKAAKIKKRERDRSHVRLSVAGADRKGTRPEKTDKPIPGK